MCCAGYEGLVGPGGEVPGHAGRGRHLRRGFQESHDGAVPENCAGGRVESNSRLISSRWCFVGGDSEPSGTSGADCTPIFINV